MKKQKILKIAVIGCGWVAQQRHIPALLKFKNQIKIEALCDVDLKKAEFVAKKFHVPLVDSNIDNILKLPIDAVCICTPPMNHSDIIRRCLESNKHVLVEKPMVIDEKEGEKLAELAKEKNLVLMTSHNFLFSDSLLKAKKIIKENKIGKILGTAGIQWSSWKRPLPNWLDQIRGGLFFDEAPHLIYLTKYFLGELDIKHVYHKKELIDNNLFERYEVIIKGEKGDGCLSVWFGAPISEWFFYIHGTKGTIVIDIFRDICYFMPAEEKRPPFYLFKTMIKFSLTGLLRMSRWFVERKLLGRKNLFGTDFIVSEFIARINDSNQLGFNRDDGFKIIKVINQIIDLSE